MGVNDVPLVAQPPAIGFKGIRPPDAPRLTLQHFKEVDNLMAFGAPHNCDAKPSDSGEWPPAMIFDVLYGCAALNTWGVPAFMEFARGRIKDNYYDEGGSGSSGGDNGGVRGRGPGGDKKSLKEKKQEREARRAKRVGLGAIKSEPDSADMILGLWMLNTRKAQRQAQVKKEGRSQEKVRAWLDSVE